MYNTEWENERNNQSEGIMLQHGEIVESIGYVVILR